MKKIMFKKMGTAAKKAVTLCAAVVIAAGTFAGVSGLEAVEAQAQYSDDWSMYYNNNFGLNSYAVTLYPGETFQLCTGNIGSVTYSSSNTKAALVSNEGLITAQNAGNAVIKVTSAAYGSCECNVLVTADNDTFTDTLDNQIDYITAADTVSLSTSKADIYIDKGIMYSPDLADIIDNIMTSIESLTGYTFLTSEYPDKVQIDIPAEKNLNTSHEINGVHLSRNEAIPELTDSYYEIAYHLLYTIQMRNTGDAGILAEGFAKSLCDEVVNNAGISSGYTTKSDMDQHYTYSKNGVQYYSSNHEYIPDRNNEFVLTADNLREIICDADNNIDAISYYLVSYIRETYGISKVRTILNDIKVNRASNSPTACFNIIVTKTSSTFASDFAQWYNNLSFPYYDTTNAGTSAYVNGIMSSLRNPEIFTKFSPYYNRFIYKNSITFDLTKAVAFAQNALGKKYWGMKVMLGGGGTATFYDAHGNVLCSSILTTGSYTYDGVVYYSTKSFSVKGAVKLVVTQSGKNTLTIVSYKTNEMYAESTEDYPISIIKNPENVSVKAGSTASFTVDATGVGLSYKWYYNDKSGESYEIDASSGSALKVTATPAMNGYSYYCQITDSNGHNEYSREGVLTVTGGFKDVLNSSAYYYNPVYWAAGNGITKGYTTGKYAGCFGVGLDCNRQEFVLFLYRLAGNPDCYDDGSLIIDSDANVFLDVKNSTTLSSNFKKAIAWAIAKGIIKGYELKNGTKNFGVGKSIVRKDAIIMLYRYAGKPQVSAAKTGFTDVDGVYKTSSDTFKAIAWAKTNNITSGLTKTQAAKAGLTYPAFGCNVSCLREQMITFIYRLNNILK